MQGEAADSHLIGYAAIFQKKWVYKSGHMYFPETYTCNTLPRKNQFSPPIYLVEISRYIFSISCPRRKRGPSDVWLDEFTQYYHEERTIIRMPVVVRERGVSSVQTVQTIII